MNKVFVTADVSPLVGRMLRKLVLFEYAEFAFEAKPLDPCKSLMRTIADYGPSLILTKSRRVAENMLLVDSQVKVILLPTREQNTYDRLWAISYDLEAFAMSRSQLLDIK